MFQIIRPGLIINIYAIAEIIQERHQCLIYLIGNSVPLVLSSEEWRNLSSAIEMANSRHAQVKRR